MPAVHSRMAAREEEAALTATIATPDFTFADDDNIAKEIEDAYKEFELQQATDGTDMDAIEAIITASVEAPSTPFELTLLCDKIAHSLRPNPRARAMTRKGRRYCIRKDHGTVARQREIKAENAAVAEGQQSKRTIRRRSNRDKTKSGNPRRFAAALKGQAKQTPRTRRMNLVAQYDIGDINACPTCYGSFSSVADGSCTYGYCIERDYTPEWLDEDWMF